MYDDCCECAARGDDYYVNKDGEVECRCPRCKANSNERKRVYEDE